jgi:hypothetical protein
LIVTDTRLPANAGGPTQISRTSKEQGAFVVTFEGGSVVRARILPDVGLIRYRELVGRYPEVEPDIDSVESRV